MWISKWTFLKNHLLVSYSVIKLQTNLNSIPFLICMQKITLVCLDQRRKSQLLFMFADTRINIKSLLGAFHSHRLRTTTSTYVYTFNLP